MKVRDVRNIVVAHRQSEGGGFIVRRPVPSAGGHGADVDPFLLIDELGPIHYGAGEAVGAPDHPHRGFETVSYILEGEVEHEDSAGNRGSIGTGDVQWMTAGAGIIHSEMPSRRIVADGGRVHGFQIWVNLPARLKMTQPRYQEVPAKKIPQATSSDGLARVRVIAGEALGVKAVIDTHTPVIYQDWSLSAGADVTLPVAVDHNVLVYVFEGAVVVGNDDAEGAVRDGEMAVLAAGDAVRLRGGVSGGRLLLLAGVPLREPVVAYGPFVMNTAEEIMQAHRDYHSGRMGEITRSATVARP